MALGAILEGVGLLMLVPLAGLLVRSGGRGQAIVGHLFDAVGATTQLARLATVLALFVLVVAIRAVVLTKRDRRLAKLLLDTVDQKRVDLIRALAGARWQDVAGLHHARVTSAIGSDIQRIAAAMQYLLQLTVAAVMLTAQWLITLLIAPALALFALSLLAGGAVMLVPSLRRARRLGVDMTLDQLNMTHSSSQFLSGLKMAMAQNAQGAFSQAFEASAQDMKQRQLAFQQRQSRARVGLATASALLGAATLTLGVWLALPITTLLSAVVVLARMNGPAIQIQQATQHFASLLPAHATLVALLNDLRVQPAVPVATTIMPPAASNSVITFDHVFYAHADGGGLTDVSVTLHPGEVVGVIGASGAGKTTFVDLLTGLLEPTGGTITVGDVRLSRHNAGRHRDRIAYVAQDPYLVNDTIRHNLMLGVPPMEDAALWQALSEVDAEQLVSALPAGLDTTVGERGARLSGGERQRIALARALLRRPALLILDEATNAIDIAGERTLIARLTEQSDRPTIVIVAHRTDTLVCCDRLLTFDRGKLIEDRRVAPIGVTETRHDKEHSLGC